VPEGRLPAPQEVVERALSTSSAEGCVVIVSDSSEAEVRFAQNTVTTNGTRRDRRVCVASFATRAEGVAVGVASRSGGGEVSDIEELVAVADADAKTAAAAEDASPLVEASEEDRSFSEAPLATGADALSAVVGGLSGAFERARGARNVLAGFATHQVTTVYLGSSTGLRRRHVQPEGTLELVARSDDGSRSAWTGAATSWFEDLDLLALEERLERRLSWAKRRVELPVGRYEVILPPDAAADLVIVLSEAMSGRDAEEGRSVFSAPSGATKVGESLSSLPFQLRGDPKEPGLECPPFVIAPATSADVSVFDNGAEVGRTMWIDSGRLERLQYHRAAAARSGTEPAFGVDNLVLELPGASGDVDELVARTDRALLLTCLWYIREVDPQTLLLTGLTRDGVYLVEHGEVVGAANNFRFNESPVEVLGRTLEAGRCERALSREWGEWMPRTAMPALRVSDFNMSSVSPAT
jgi:predicted Zn-dependent protease